MTNGADPDQTASESSLIRVFTVCYSDKHFVNSSPENLRTEGETVQIFRTF